MNKAGNVKLHGHAVGGVGAEASAKAELTKNGFEAGASTKAAGFGEVGAQVGTKHNFVGGTVKAGEVGGKVKGNISRTESKKHLRG